MKTLRACNGGSTTAAAMAVSDADGGRRRQQAAGPRTVKAAQRNGVGGADLAPEQAGDQEAGDDEEDVDADEAAGGTGYARVVEHDGKHRDGAQPLDVRAEPAPLRLAAGVSARWQGRAGRGFLSDCHTSFGCLG